MAWLTPCTRRLAPLAALALLLAGPPPLWAAEEEQPSKGEPPQTLMQMIEESGTSGIGFMVGLGLFSVAAVTVVIERLVNLTRGKVVPPAFVRDLGDLLRRGGVRAGELRELCERHPAPAAKVLRAGLLRAGRPAPEVEKAMEDAAAREVAALRGRVRPLSVIGSVAPLVGLLGTVVGMIIAFRTASEQGLGGRAELLAEGIYLALLTTAAGLTIAIPALLFATYFHSRIDGLMREMDESLSEAVPRLARTEPENADADVTDQQLVSA